MTLWKRGNRYWSDVTVNGQRYREPLDTTDWREAREIEKHRIAELTKRPPDRARRGYSYGALDVKTAIDTYAEERRAQVSARMVGYWKENAKPLAAFFGSRKLRALTTSDL